jgi:hypothetical protein
MLACEWVTGHEFWVKKSRSQERLFVHSMKCCWLRGLTQQRHHLLRRLVGLRNHRVACLLQDLRT